DTFETALILDPSDDAARDGLVAALASGAPLTGAVLGALRWIAGLGAPLRVALWAVIATTIVVLVVRDAATTAGRVIAMSTATTLAALVLLQWLATPMIDAVALLSARGRELVRGARRRTALAASALLVAGCAVTAALVAWHGEPRWAQGAALCVLVSAAALGRAARD
ncbi:MAG: hypothetical protein MUF21_08030, partial [Gemmatimonadaceae bacterium]|nr:hypothetical protein [Gemmatimonadaceae bacterium]